LVILGLPGFNTELQKKEEKGPVQELSFPSESSFFCNQVFFDYDPSSSTSLLSSIGVTTRETREE